MRFTGLIKITNYTAAIFLTALHFTAWTQTRRTGSELQGTLPSVLSGGVYIATGQLIVPAGKTVRISGGTTIYFKSFSGITVKGTLFSEGEPDRKVVFTSIQESGTKPGAQPGPADWNGVKVDKEADGIFMEYTSIRYSTFGVEVTSSEPSIHLRDISFHQNGLSNLTVGGTQILSPDMAAGSKPVTYVHSGNHRSGESVQSITSRYPEITGKASSVLPPGEYIVNGTLVIPQEVSFTIQSPSVIRFTPGSSVLVKGKLETDGGSGGTGKNMKKIPGVIFTSYRYGGSGVNAPAPCDWGGIRVVSECKGVFLNSVSIDYSTYGIRTQGSAVVHAEEIHFGTHNGVLKSDGFRSVSDIPVEF